MTAPANNLVLSIFPGIGLFDRGFEAAGFCVVRGPDVLAWLRRPAENGSSGSVTRPRFYQLSHNNRLFYENRNL